MNYLSPPEYEAYGLDATTPAALVTGASTLIDAHCRRATLGQAQYQERLRVAAGRNTIRLTYLPLSALPPARSAIVSLRARYAIPRRGEWPWVDAFQDFGPSVAYFFGLPSSWIELDPGEVDVFEATGELTLPTNALGLGLSEFEVV